MNFCDNKNKKRFYINNIALALVYFFVFLMLRYQFNIELSDFLWAEDGSVFINEAYKYGIKSLITPYYGYLHLYPRIFAYISTYFDVKFVQVVFVLGWSVSVFALIYVSIKCLENKISNNLFRFLIVFLILIQPSSGEIFFTLTNSQWMLGFVLVAILFFDPPIKNFYKYPIIATLSLTGPFCIFVVAVMILDMIRYKCKRIKIEFIILIVCSLVQLFYIESSNRLGARIDNSAFDWSVAFVRLMMFGIKYNLVCFIMIGLFWSVFVVSCKIRKIDLINCNDFNTPEAKLVLSGFLFFVASLLMSSDPIVLLSSTGPGSRYYWISYSGFIIYFGLRANCLRFEKYILATILIAVFAIQGQTIVKEKMYFDSYIKFASCVDIKIPINPAINKYPGWHVDSSLLGIKNHNCGRVSVYDDVGKKYDFKFSSKGNSLGIIINVKDYSGGVAAISINEADGKCVSLKRYFNPLSSELYFAYTKSTEDIIVTVRDLANGGVNISSIKLYDLDK